MFTKYRQGVPSQDVTGFNPLDHGEKKELPGWAGSRGQAWADRMSHSGGRDRTSRHEQGHAWGPVAYREREGGESNYFGS